VRFSSRAFFPAFPERLWFLVIFIFYFIDQISSIPRTAKNTSIYPVSFHSRLFLTNFASHAAPLWCWIVAGPAGTVA
jgi:hypothetical protein